MSEDKDTKISKQVIGVSPELLKLQDSLGKGRSVIGIDIGSTSVNVVQVASHYGKLTLIKASLEPISVVQERDRENLTIAALKKVLSRFHTKKADIVCVLSSRQTMVESILMPLMPKEELFHAVNLVVTNSKRFNVEKPIFDFQVAGRTNQDGAEKLNVTTAVIDRMSVDNLLAKFTLRQAKPLAGANSDLQTEGPVGLEVTAIIPLAIAVENIIRKSKLRTDEIVAIVEMGSLATELNIYRDSHLELSRQISVTSATLTHSLTRSFFTDKGRVELTVAEAEEIKKKYGIAPLEEGYLVNEKIPAQQVLSLLRPGLEQLVQEITRSFDYYRERMFSGKVDRIILFGGEARMKGLLEFLSAELGMPVVLGNPLLDVESLFDGVVENKEDAPRLAPALGAALSDLKGINLLPAHLKDRKKKSLERIIIAGVLAFLVLVIGGVYIGLSAKKMAASQQTAVVSKEYKAFLPQLKEFQDELSLKEMIRSRLNAGALFKTLSAFPDNVYLTQLELKKDSILIAGIVMGKTNEVSVTLDQVIKALQEDISTKASLFSKKAAAGKADTVEFKIKGDVKRGGAL